MGATRTRRSTRRTLSVFATFGLVAATLTVLAPAASGVVNTCKARNLTQGTVARSNLQRVINAADPGDTIAVKYVCVGNFQIAKRLTLIGKATHGVPKPVLHGNVSGRTLLVSARVKLVNLKITGGYVDTFPWNGGGIYNTGRLVLKDTVVAGNTALGGGGIFNYEGAVSLNGSSSVTGNTAQNSGGGISTVRGSLILNGSSSVSGNTATTGGGGIDSAESKVTLNGSSSVGGNTDQSGGGGIVSNGVLTLNDSSSVSGNTTFGNGGGIFNNNTVVLKDSSSVTENTAGVAGGGVFVNIGSISACDDAGVDEWTGAISPNDPDDPPTVTMITCT